MTKKTPNKKAGRINLRLPPSLVEWAKIYAKANDTNLTTLVREGLEELRKTKEAPRGIDQY